MQHLYGYNACLSIPFERTTINFMDLLFSIRREPFYPSGLVLDRQNAVRWLRFLMNAGNNIVEMRLRNDFMHYLVLNLQESHLRPPFDKPPPNIDHLREIADLIVSKYNFS